MLLCCYSLIIFYQSLFNWLPFFILISKYSISFIGHWWCMQHEGLVSNFWSHNSNVSRSSQYLCEAYHVPDTIIGHVLHI